MKQLSTLGWPAALCLLVLAGCEKPSEDGSPLGASLSQNGSNARTYVSTDFDGPAGGATTVQFFDAMAFAQPSPNLSGAKLQAHLDGQGSFEQVWTLSQLAPLWNNEKCSGCHVNGGRSPLRPNPQLLFRVSIPGTNPDGGPKPVPGIGDQIQPFVVLNGARGIGPEGTVSTTYVEQLRSFVDGQTYSLRQPTYTPSASLPADVMISPRIGGQVAGLGLLEAVPESFIKDLADPKDDDKDGITGRVNMVWDVAAQDNRLGRFGWKANQPGLLQQAAAAFNGDLGITSPYFPLESNAPGGGRNKKGKRDDDPSTTPVATDITATELFNTAYYTATLGVPDTRNSSGPLEQAGRAIFLAAKCAACHVPVMQTGNVAGFPELSNQTIHPYTDLLLHDMGPGLADGRPDFRATGSEWRTAPLWGLGLSATTSNHTNYLHDGRARNVIEAIMWHGGEGEVSRRYVEQLTQTERNALVAFVNSL